METCLEIGNALISDLIEEATGSKPVAPTLISLRGAPNAFFACLLEPV